MHVPVADSSVQHITVAAPARLHMGFLDLGGGRGRSFGSLGLTISGLTTKVLVWPSDKVSVAGPEAPRAEKIVRGLLDHYGEAKGVHLLVDEAIPAHAGLGSGTQLALAVGMALARLFGWETDGRTIAQLTGRGGRSGIGIGAFDTGGFLIDGGKGQQDEPPRILVRTDFPSQWRLLLIFDRQAQGIHGDREVTAFKTLPEFPAVTAGELCRLALTQALPALQEENLEEFGSAIGAIQRAVGDYFAPAQGGRFASPRVGEALNWLEEQGIGGIGQSSWGPTGFAVLASATVAGKLLRKAQGRWGTNGPLYFMVCSGLNRGGEICI